MNGRSWTTEEVDLLRREHGTCLLEEIGAKIGRTRTACNSKLRELRKHHAPVTRIPIYRVARALGLRWQVVRQWQALGLRMTPGAGCGDRRVQAIEPADLQAFLVSRPELWTDDSSPRLLRALGVDPVPILKRVESARYKRVTCWRADEHASCQPVEFWAPRAAHRVNCPACGALSPSIATGDESGRYASQFPAVPVMTRLSAFHMAVLGDLTRADRSVKELARLHECSECRVRDAFERLVLLGLAERPGDGTIVSPTPEGLALYKGAPDAEV